MEKMGEKIEDKSVAERVTIKNNIMTEIASKL